MQCKNCQHGSVPFQIVRHVSKDMAMDAGDMQLEGQPLIENLHLLRRPLREMRELSAAYTRSGVVDFEQHPLRSTRWRITQRLA